MSSIFLTDEELGKKDDDHKPAKLPPLRSHHWSPARVPVRKTLKRLAIVLIIGLGVYLFIKNIPTDVPIRDRRRPVYGQTDETLPFRPPHGTAKSNPPANFDESVRSAGRTYNAPARFPNLGTSLQAISSTRGSLLTNKNVLFVASSLKSVAALLPMACRMGSELRSYVHFALMSRSEIDIDELRAINGIDDSCQVIFHDARPDYSSISTEARLEACTSRALFHIYGYMHPQAVIVDGSSTEEVFFLGAMRQKAHNIGVPLIELPESAPKRLTWMTKLDSSSLAAWNRVNVEILIQAPPGGSGSLIRLLRSLSSADFTSCAIPHLTIELPRKIDPFTAKYLETFQWPPAHVHNPSHTRQLSLRRRIPRQSPSEEESAVRFLESFWPSNPRDSHVLVLSPQAELSPRFFHYLKYSLLEYGYSNAAVLQEWDRRLLGISLDLPATYLNVSEPFLPPTRKDAVHLAAAAAAATDEPTSFLWQAPNSNAVLFFGQKWVELHGFVSRLVDFQHGSPSPAPLLSEKLVSKRYPAWLEHALKLSRARGYWTLYPSKMTASNLATIHNELYTPPEEYEADATRDPSDATEIILADGPLLDRLPNGGNLPPFNQLPLVTWDGLVTKLHDFDSAASDYAAKFRRTIGGCEDLLPSDLLPQKSAGDLFCSKEA